MRIFQNGINSRINTLVREMEKPKYEIGQVVLFAHGWNKDGSRNWVGAKVARIYPKDHWHLSDKEGLYFKYRILIPPELVYGEWLDICEPHLRLGTEDDLRYKGEDGRKDPSIQRMLDDVRMRHGI